MTLFGAICSGNPHPHCFDEELDVVQDSMIKILPSHLRPVMSREEEELENVSVASGIALNSGETERELSGLK